MKNIVNHSIVTKTNNKIGDDIVLMYKLIIMKNLLFDNNLSSAWSDLTE